MASCFGLLFCLISVILLNLFSYAQRLGAPCTLTESDRGGVCTIISYCPSVLDAAIAGREPQVCIGSGIGTLAAVCCEPQAPTPAPGLTCPPLPRGAVNVASTGSKAHDYCIGLAEKVFPCQQEGGLWSRGNLCSSAAPTATASAKEGSVVVQAGEFPHLALLGVTDGNKINWRCSGTLISEGWVMSSAYCLEGIKDTSKRYARLGGTSGNHSHDPSNLFRVVARYVRADYRSDSWYSDISLLQLEREVIISPTVFPACIQPSVPMRDNVYSYAGVNYSPEGFYRLKMEGISSEDCTSKIMSDYLKKGVKNESQICAESKSSFVKCRGANHGAPLHVDNAQKVACTSLVVGLLSYVSICESPRQAVLFTRVAAFVPWIEGIVWP